MNSVVAFTVIYPSALKYLDDFASCLRSQTYQNFDLLVVNDGCEEDSIREYLESFNLSLINASSSPAKNREIGIRYAFDRGYSYLIFCDIDDWFMSNRFQISLDSFEGVDIVVNNLNIVSEDHKMLCCDYFSYSIDKNTVIDSVFLRDKNILGLSNTSIKLQVKSLVDFPENIPIGDWYYYSVCLNRGLKVRYLPESLTDYRQHGDNLIGIDDFTLSLFKKLVNYKIIHYENMSKISPDFLEMLIEMKGLTSMSDAQIEQIIKKNKENNKHPLWWENVKL